MPRPKILSSLPAQSEVVETATTLTFKIVLLAPDRVGEIISAERIGDKLVVKTKVKEDKVSQPTGPFTVSFE